jgi:hypothetical protein
MTTKYKKLLSSLLAQNNSIKSPPPKIAHNAQAGDSFSYSQKEIDAITQNLLKNMENLPVVDNLSNEQVKTIEQYIVEVDDEKLILDSFTPDFIGDMTGGKNPRFYTPDSIDFSIHQNPSVSINRLPTDTKNICFVSESGVSNDSIYVAIPSATNMLGVSIVGDNSINCLLDFDGKKIGGIDETKYLNLITTQNSGCIEYQNLGINILKNQVRFFEITGKSGFYIHFVNTANKAVADFTQQACFVCCEFYKN